MANKYRGQVELHIEEEDGSVTVYKLHYDANALVEIEEGMNMPINTILSQHLNLMDGFKFQRVALWAGLQRDPRGRKLNLKQCGEILSTSREQRAEIGKAIFRGVFLALGADLAAAQAEVEALERAAAENDIKPKEGSKSPLECVPSPLAATGTS